MKGYIYIRTHKSYELHNAIKLGITENLINRENTYITSEIEKGYYIMAFEMDILKIKPIEKLLHYEFSKDKIYVNAGTEFFNTSIISKIEPFLSNLNLQFKILLSDDILKIIRKERVKTYFSKIDKKKLIQSLRKNINPKEFQIEIIKNVCDYLDKNEKGVVILPCGAGKTFTSLLISKQCDFKTILIGVPSILLLIQWVENIKKIFDYNILCVKNSINISEIEQFILNNKNLIIITTYASCHKVKSASKNINFTFDVKILDEIHHLTNILNENDKTFIQILNINSLKQISLTATLKILEDENVNFVSNNNELFFGKIVIEKCLLWGIKLNIICDYVVKIVSTLIDDIQKITPCNILDYDKKLFLSAYVALQSLNDSTHHILIYANSCENSIKIINYIKFLLDKEYFKFENFYCSNYDSFMKENEKNTILNNFNSSIKGVISCVYCLSEGYDNPIIDGVVVSENMSSNIRIVQALLRAGRKNKNELTKITKIILPILYKDNLFNDMTNTDLLKVKQVIQKIGIEDETVNEKIKIYKLNIQKNQKINNPVEENVIECNELKKFINFQTIARDNITLNYNQAKKLLYNKNIKTKNDYYILCDSDKRFYTNPNFYFENFNWVDYLNIPKIYYDLNLCKNKIVEYITMNENLKKGSYDFLIMQLCNLDKNFPPFDFWLDYYEIDDITLLFNVYKKSKLQGI
jgi:predicted helicase